MTRVIWPFAQLTVARKGGVCGKWAKTYLTKSMILDFIARRALANDRLLTGWRALVSGMGESLDVTGVWGSVV